MTTPAPSSTSEPQFEPYVPTVKDVLVVGGVGLGAVLVIYLSVLSIQTGLAPEPSPSDAAGGPAASPDDGAAAAGPMQLEDELVVFGRDRVAPDDPDDPAWDDVAYYEVTMGPQNMAAPSLMQPTVPAMRVQAIHDGERVAFRFAWRDETQDMNVDAGRYCDAVAIGFPVDQAAPPMMGGQNARMQIIFWKGLWQKDVDAGFQDVQDLHPNFYSDLYWFAEGGLPYPVPGAFEDERSHDWFPAKQAGNPVSQFGREQPVQELLAEGWGTLTTQPRSVSTGEGRWKDGEWSVVISRPLTSDDEIDYQFAAGESGQAAFAVWDGSKRQRGARKQWSMQWVPFTFEEVSR